ncbi:hypothetical protein BAL199_00455 [alpha proteobacterium BAL199]|nr:hypothetical protein BAL199_00455 [alpha proteobacterium BAL199]
MVMVLGETRIEEAATQLSLASLPILPGILCIPG